MESSDNLIKYYKLIYDFYHDFDSSAFYFRGHSKQSYQLLPSVFRSPYWNAEDYLYHEIMVRCPDKFNISSH